MFSFDRPKKATECRRTKNDETIHIKVVKNSYLFTFVQKFIQILDKQRRNLKDKYEKRVKRDANI